MKNLSEDRSQIPPSPVLKPQNDLISKATNQNLKPEDCSWIAKFQRLKSTDYYSNSEDGSPFLPPTEATTTLNNQVTLKKAPSRRIIVPVGAIKKKLATPIQRILSPAQRAKRHKEFTSFPSNLEQVETRRNRKLNTFKMPSSVSRKVPKIYLKEDLTSSISESAPESEKLVKLKNDNLALQRKNAKLVTENAELTSKLKKLSLLLKAKNLKYEGKQEPGSPMSEYLNHPERHPILELRPFATEIEHLQELISTMGADSLKRQEEMDMKFKDTFKILLEKDVMIQELEERNDELEAYFNKQKKDFIEASEYNHVATQNSALRSNIKMLSSRIEGLEKANQDLLVKALQLKAKSASAAQDTEIHVSEKDQGLNCIEERSESTT
ncbi:unnamed protein product [Moneuplotes crassus]|uniref:Uncharacterized protein n=1 Tax=Euplotes crassus TaxID=5936 RepID=A0AAD1X6D2_EUPCR|nr:unnamed protein product [Moneuplotes crassus]